MVKTLDHIINEWVNECFADFKFIPPKKKPKIIKDPIWNMIALSPLECSLMDSPIIQRLRRIHQTGLTFLIYPAAVHTRFEHTLGVVQAVTRVANTLTFSEKLGLRMREIDLQEMRLAALLHDVGHCALSHLSEPHIGTHAVFTAYEEKFREVTGLMIKPHELMGYCIVKTKAFEDIFGQMVRENAGYHEIKDYKRSLTRIADMIVGYAPEGNKEQLYLSNIVNGAFDADKIDYIARDSYFTGIALGAEMEMLIHKLEVHPTTIFDGKTGGEVEANCIIVDYVGGVAYEQIAMSKKSLNVNVYNHQKVMAVHEMARDIIHDIIRGKMEVNGRKYDDPSLFLKLSDWDILAGTTKSKVDRNLQKKISMRILPRRALRIATHTVENQTVPNLVKFYDRINDDENNGRINFREEVAETAGLDSCQVYVAVPKVPNTRELMEGKCLFPDGNIEDIGKHFAGGVESYGIRREISYVYALDCSVQCVADAAKTVLESNKYGNLKFTLNATSGLDN